MQRVNTCLHALAACSRQLVRSPGNTVSMRSSAAVINAGMPKMFVSPSLARSMCAASNEAAGSAADNSADPRRIRPVVSPAERRRELFLYKQQVHELRVKYKQEWEAKVEASQAGKAERAAEFWKKVEAYRKIKDEKTKVRRQIAAETLARLREEKAAEKVKKRERQASWKQVQVEKSRERFSMQLIESRDWSCDPTEVSQLVHEALVAAAKPHYVNPTRRFQD